MARPISIERCGSTPLAGLISPLMLSRTFGEREKEAASNLREAHRAREAGDGAGRVYCQALTP